ncbi:MAG TPA: hypothetical protein VGI46_15485 [Candidatus Acidoferrum sp.]|jgi:hypothetical protein
MQSNTISLFDFTFSSGDLVFAAAILLALAALLLIFSRRRKIMLQESLVTEELLILLARVADALEAQAVRTPDRLIADLVAALKQQNAAMLQTSPLQPPPLSTPPTPTPPQATRENPPIASMRFPSYSGEMPQD